MRVLIDTSTDDLFLSLIDSEKTVVFKHVKNLVRKADNLPMLFREMMQGVSAEEVKDFYITIGPGSFTGARVGLVFVRSIAQITGAKIFTTTSLQFIAGPEGQREIYVDARSNKSYYAIVKEGKLSSKITLVPFEEGPKPDYKKIVKSPFDYLNIFTLEKDILAIRPTYIKDPTIGGK